MVVSETDSAIRMVRHEPESLKHSHHSVPEGTAQSYPGAWKPEQLETGTTGNRNNWKPERRPPGSRAPLPGSDPAYGSAGQSSPSVRGGASLCHTPRSLYRGRGELTLGSPGRSPAR